jgi:hypothetical protein
MRTAGFRARLGSGSQKSLRPAITSVLAAWVLVLAAASPVAAYRPELTFNLTLLGDVPKHEIFAIYLQTDPPSYDATLHWICPAGGPAPTFRCVSGETSTYRVTFPRERNEVATTWVFRYQRWLGDDPEGPVGPRDFRTFYEGRVTLTAEQPTAVFNVTYDFNLELPDAAAALRDRDEPALGLVVLLGLVPPLALVLLGRRGRPAVPKRTL